MKSIINILIILSCIALHSACVKQSDDAEGPLRKGDVQIALNLPIGAAIAAKATIATPEENYIGNLKVFITPYTADHNQPIEMVLDINPSDMIINDRFVWNNTTQRLTIKGLANRGIPRNIYIVANWQSDIKAGALEQTLIGALTSISGAIVAPTADHPLLMSGGTTQHNFEKNPALNIDLQRQVAKIEVTLVLDAEFAKAYPEVTIKDDARLQAIRVPDQSYIIPNTTIPIGASLLNYDMQAGVVSGANEWKTTFYVYENLFRGPTIDQFSPITSLHLNMPYQLSGQSAVTENYYTISIKTDDPIDPYIVKRNNLYRLRGTINGFGGTMPGDGSSSTVTTTVKVWDQSNIGVDMTPKYFNITRNRITFNVSDTEHKVTISTDVSDWKLVNADGATIFSYADNQTVAFINANLTYTISGNAATATITITRNSADTFIEQKMTLVAQNIKVPFTVVDGHVAIPNTAKSLKFK